jgi:hypothetical protein
MPFAQSDWHPPALIRENFRSDRLEKRAVPATIFGLVGRISLLGLSTVLHFPQALGAAILDAK